MLQLSRGKLDNELTCRAISHRDKRGRVLLSGDVSRRNGVSHVFEGASARTINMHFIRRGDRLGMAGSHAAACKVEHGHSRAAPTGRSMSAAIAKLSNKRKRARTNLIRSLKPRGLPERYGLSKRQNPQPRKDRHC